MRRLITVLLRWALPLIRPSPSRPLPSKKDGPRLESKGLDSTKGNGKGKDSGKNKGMHNTTKKPQRTNTDFKNTNKSESKGHGSGGSKLQQQERQGQRQRQRQEQFQGQLPGTGASRKERAPATYCRWEFDTCAAPTLNGILVETDIVVPPKRDEYSRSDRHKNC